MTASMTASAAVLVHPTVGPRHRRRSRWTERARRVASVGSSLMLVTVVLFFLAMTLGPRVFGYRTLTMLTGSMAPHIVPGDVVIDVPQRTSALRVGQIITYAIPVQDHRVESHRVVWVRYNADGTTSVRTKGDANAGVDPWTATISTPTVWRVRAVVPYAGTVIRALRGPLVSRLLTWAVPAVLIVSALLAIWRPRREPGHAPPG